MDTKQRVKQAKARYGYEGRIVVDKCPYCSKTHYHMDGGPDDNFQRLADCFQGEYILVFGTVETGE